MTTHAPAGLFISFEGVDGAGKTTQVERLRDYFAQQGRRVIVTREPGGTGLGVRLRQMLLHGGEISPRAEALLFAADRAQHVAEVIMWATGGLLPRRTYLLDVDPQVSHRRLTHGEDRMESAGYDFQRRTREEFLNLARADAGRFLVVDASAGIETVWDTIRTDADALLGGVAASTSAGISDDVQQTGECRP